MRIQLVRNATVRLSFGSQTFLIDPWFAKKGQGKSYTGQASSPLVDLPMSVAEIMEGADAVVVSHLHSDHFDEAARAALDRDIPIYCHLRFAEEIRAFGFSNVTPLTQSTVIDGISVRVTEGRHGPDEILGVMGPVSGFVFRVPNEPVFYWAGDTILCDEVRDVIKAERPDVIVVHACGAIWDGIEPLVMDAEMTLETLRISEPAMVVATHLDAVDHATVSRRELKEAAGVVTWAKDRLLIPEDGEGFSFEA
jgi:L-ascorbate metabolism protein UlaG (beta-lactamase superfamily)